MFHVYLLSKLNFFPYPELFVYPYLASHGLLPYKQIFDQHFPGLLFLPINFGTLGLTTESAARVWQYGAIFITQILLFCISAQVLKSKIKAVAVCFLYLLWQPFLQGWMLWTNNFLGIFYLSAFYFSFKALETKKNFKVIFLAGLTFGLATVFKQVALPVAGLTFIYLWFFQRTFKTFVSYAIGYGLPLLGMLGWLGLLGVIGDWWFWTVQFNLTTYARMGGKAPTWGELIRLTFVYLPSLASFYRAKGDSLKLAGLLAVFIWGGMFGGGHRFDLTYFQPSLPFVCIALVIGFGELKRLGKLGVLGILGYTLIAGVFLRQFYRSNSEDYVYYFDSGTQKVAEEIKKLTTSGEQIFVFGATPLLYQQTQTLPAGKVFVFQFPWFLVDGGHRIYQGLVNTKPNIVISDPTTQTDNQKITDFAPQIYSYIYSNYHLKEKIGTIEILEKNR